MMVIRNAKPRRQQLNPLLPVMPPTQTLTSSSNRWKWAGQRWSGGFGDGVKLLSRARRCAGGVCAGGHFAGQRTRPARRRGGHAAAAPRRCRPRSTQVQTCGRLWRQTGVAWWASASKLVKSQWCHSGSVYFHTRCHYRLPSGGHGGGDGGARAGGGGGAGEGGGHAAARRRNAPAALLQGARPLLLMGTRAPLTGTAALRLGGTTRLLAVRQRRHCDGRTLLLLPRARTTLLSQRSRRASQLRGPCCADARRAPLHGPDYDYRCGGRVSAAPPRRSARDP